MKPNETNPGSMFMRFAGEVLSYVRRKVRLRTRASYIGNELREELQRSVCETASRLLRSYSTLFGRLYENSTLFIFGCQRSGTTMLWKTFDKDPRTACYPEFSELSCRGAEGLRWHPFPEVREELRKNTRPLIVLEPLVESQNADRILQ